MTRTYSRAAETIDLDPVAPYERERPMVTRTAAHETRGAVADREDGVRIERDPMKWVNPSNLDAPTPQAGFVQRWISDGSQPGSANERHWLKKMREGWSPRDPSTVPASQRIGFPSSKLSDGTSAIRVAGLVLCEMPRTVALQRHEAVNDLIKRQTKSLPESTEQLRARARGSNGVTDMKVTDTEQVVRGRRAATMTD
jgi:hypothetical protein